nr:hypothetical protein [Tanacetum cinerariifolium]
MKEPEKPVKVKGKDQIALAFFPLPSNTFESIGGTIGLDAVSLASFIITPLVLEGSGKKAESSGKEAVSKMRTKEQFDQESFKRQKTSKSSKLAKEPRDKEADKLSQEELQQMMIIVIVQGMNVEALQTNLVKEKFNSTEPTYNKEREIWVKLKRLFEPDTDDEFWKLQKHIHDLTWKLYDSYGVHHGRIVRFKRLLSAVEVTAANMEVTTTGSSYDCWLWFLLLVKTAENILSYYYC